MKLLGRLLLAAGAVALGLGAYDLGTHHAPVLGVAGAIGGALLAGMLAGGRVALWTLRGSR